MRKHRSVWKPRRMGGSVVSWAVAAMLTVPLLVVFEKAAEALTTMSGALG